jgi:hypothetical protein
MMFIALGYGFVVTSRVCFAFDSSCIVQKTKQIDIIFSN